MNSPEILAPVAGVVEMSKCATVCEPDAKECRCFRLPIDL